MATPNAKNPDEIVLRCPFCKTHLQSAEGDCPICGEALTTQNVLRVKASVRIFSKPLLSEADKAEARNQTASSSPIPVSPTPETPVEAPAPTAPPITKPRTEPLKPPRPLTQPNPRVDVQNPRPTTSSPSGYTVGILVGFAVIVLGAAILIGVNLARQTTTEAKATGEEVNAVQQTVQVTLVHQSAEATHTPFAPTGTALPTKTAIAATPTSEAVSEPVVRVTASQPTAAPTLTPTLEIIPIFSPTPTKKPTLVPTATKLPPSPSVTPSPSQTPQPSATATATSTATPTAVPPTPVPPTQTTTPTAVVATWNLALTSARYETSGRPRQACSSFDASDPVRKFTFTLHITQTTGRDFASNDWGVAAFVGDARVAQVCYFQTEGPTPPALPNGEARQITLSAFISQGQSITSLVVGDTTGSAERVCVKDTLVVACK